MPLPFAAVGLGAKLLGVKKKLASVPWQVWAVIALVIAGGVGGCIAKNKHQAAVKEFGDQRYNEGRASRDAEIKAAQDAKAEADRKLAAALREKANAENARIATRANDLRLRGPGAATCTNPPAARTGTSGHNAAPAEPNAPGLGVPTEQWAAVPWGWLVKRGEEHDKCLVEAGAWREQKAAEIKAYNESQR